MPLLSLLINWMHPCQTKPAEPKLINSIVSACSCCSVFSAEPVHMSGDQRLKSAKENARENHAAMQRELDARRLKVSRHTGSSGESAAPVQVKQEPMSDSEEPMDTSGLLTNGSINGYPNSTSLVSDPHNGHGHTFTRSSRTLCGAPSGSTMFCAWVKWRGCLTCIWPVYPRGTRCTATWRTACCRTPSSRASANRSWCL